MPRGNSKKGTPARGQGFKRRKMDDPKEKEQAIASVVNPRSSDCSVKYSVKRQSLLLESVLEAAGFSATQIELNRNFHKFHDFVRKQLCDVAENIYVGSISEGIAGGFYYSGEPSDLDVILPLFKQIIVYDNDTLNTLSEKEKHDFFNEIPNKKRSTFYAFHDNEFPGYMKMMWPFSYPLRIENEPVKLKARCVPNEFAHELIREQRAENQNITMDITKQYEKNGPAFTEKIRYSVPFSPEYSSDSVPCLKYDYWPPCANEWINRSKVTGWPPNQIIKQVVAEKCWLAPVGNFDSSNKDIQWRLSMRGENILFGDLNNIQIHCYIMLKIVLKDRIRPLFDNDNLKDILSSYCLKNLIFWCAEKEKLDWTPSNLIGCFKQCIQKLIKYLKERCLPHYIIEERNLFNPITLSHSTSLQVALNEFKDNVRVNILKLRSFEKLQALSGKFDPELLKKVTERSIILQCWDYKIKSLYDDFTTFQFLWLKYDRYPSLKSIQRYKDILSEIENYKGFTVFKNEYTVMINSIIGMLSYSLYRQNQSDKQILNEAIKYLNGPNKSVRSCILLRLASFFFMERMFENAIKVCTKISNQITHITPSKRTWDKVKQSQDHLLTFLPSMKTEILRNLRESILAASYSIELQNRLVLENKYILNKFKNGMFVNPHFKVTYMTAEMWAVPDVLQYELLSVPEKLKTFYDDKFPCPQYDEIPSIRIHPLLNCYLLQYLCYEALGKTKLCHEVLTKLNNLTAKEATVDENCILFYNVVAYCNKKSGYYREAAKNIMRSLEIESSSCNAASGYLKSIINQSLILVNELNISSN